jgi:hypothetical protein
MLTSLSSAETWLRGIFLALGGMAGVAKILEWVMSGPKIKCFWEADVVGDVVGTTADGAAKVLGTHIMVLVDAVNVRMKPISITGWNLEVRTKSGTYVAEKLMIPDGFSVTMANGKQNVTDFAKARLYEKTLEEPLLYGKTVRGWLRFAIPNVAAGEINDEITYIFVLRDAFGGNHRIKCKRQNRGSHEMFFSGAGMG